MAQTATLHQLSVLVQRLAERQGGRELILIDGYPAAGKTTFAMELAAMPRVAWTPAEIFLADGRLDTRKVRRDLVRPFRREGKVREVVPSMSGSGMQRGRPQSGTRVLIIEGVGIAEAAKHLRADQVWWMDCDTEIRAERLTHSSAAGVPGATFSDMKHRMIQAEAADLRAKALRVTDVIVSTDHEPMPRIAPDEADAAIDHSAAGQAAIETSPSTSPRAARSPIAASANGMGVDSSHTPNSLNGDGDHDVASVAAALGSTSALLGGLHGRSDDDAAAPAHEDEDEIAEFDDDLSSKQDRPIPGTTPVSGQRNAQGHDGPQPRRRRRVTPRPAVDGASADDAVVDLASDGDAPELATDEATAEADALLPAKAMLADDVLSDDLVPGEIFGGKAPRSGDLGAQESFDELLPGSVFADEQATPNNHVDSDDPMSGLMPSWLDD